MANVIICGGLEYQTKLRLAVLETLEAKRAKIVLLDDVGTKTIASDYMNIICQEMPKLEIPDFPFHRKQIDPQTKKISGNYEKKIITPG